MKILVDMNLSPRWAGMLTVAGFDAVHWSRLGAPNAPDREIMEFAKTGGYVVLTHDLDFSAILAATQGAKPSVVQIRSGDVSPDVIGSQVALVLTQVRDDLERGALVTFDTARTRIRLLPLLFG